MERWICVDNVTKILEGKKIIKNLSLNIRQNEIFGIVGPSGSGKTTFLKTLIGFYKIDAGRIFIRDKEISRNLNIIRRIFGFTTQENCFYGELNLLENIEYFGKMFGIKSDVIKQRSEILLKMVGLWDSKDKLASNISGGMKRRLDLVISLIHDPKILILDELTAGLDPLLRREILDIIRAINESGVTIIMSSHMLDEIEDLCDNIVFIKDGSLVLHASPKDIKKKLYNYEQVEIVSYPGNYQKFLKELSRMEHNVLRYTIVKKKLVLYTKKAPLSLLHIMDSLNNTGESLIDIEVKKPKLEEAFHSLYKK